MQSENVAICYIGYLPPSVTLSTDPPFSIYLYSGRQPVYSWLELIYPAMIDEDDGSGRPAAVST